MNEAEFSARVKARERQLYRVSYAILGCDADACDAVQEALLNAWLHIGGLREDTYFETWLVRILINECKKILRKRRVWHTPLPDAATSPQTPDPVLAEAMTTLAPKERLALVLHHLEGFSIVEIARMLRVPEGTVKSRLSRARASLRIALKRRGGYEQ